MCIAILQTKNSKMFDKNELRKFHNSNPHGMGLLYATSNRLHYVKQLHDFNSFYDSYYSIASKFLKYINIVLHFRFATAGRKDIANCHPFFVNKDLAFVHNGIIEISVLDHSKSDTVTFNKEVLKKLPNNFLQDKKILMSLKPYMSWSRFIFLNSKGEYTILGDDSGQWKDSIWYSHKLYGHF